MGFDNLSAALKGEQSLFRLTLSGSALRDVYVVATSFDEAASKVLDPMEKDSYGFSYNRVVEKIELLAESKLYSPRGVLFV